MAKMHDLDLDSEFDSDSALNSSGFAENGKNSNCHFLLKNAVNLFISKKPLFSGSETLQKIPPVCTRTARDGV
jgi:hypothetical protein